VLQRRRRNFIHSTNLHHFIRAPIITAALHTRINISHNFCYRFSFVVLSNGSLFANVLRATFFNRKTFDSLFRAAERNSPIENKHLVHHPPEHQPNNVKHLIVGWEETATRQIPSYWK
jgi:hypothetical protein